MQMPDANDMDLVREFARTNSEAAFAELVRRHINLVHSVARRLTSTDGDAQDVTQAVFIILARKAGSLREKTLLTGWLYETTRFTAARLRRTHARRHAREQEAYMQSTLNEADTAAVWEKLSPHLEAAMDKLAERDRTLLALRFYENKTAAETAVALNLTEAAANKRATRAVEKLRKIFAQRGVTLTATAIAGAVSANAVQAAPVALVKTISVVAVTKGAAATTSTLFLVKGTMKLMAWAKMKTASLVGAGVLAATSATAYLWETSPATFENLYKAKPQVEIHVAKNPDDQGGAVSVDDQTLGINMPFENLIYHAYGVNEYRAIISTGLPTNNFDYISKRRFGDARKALQQQIKRQFGIVGRFETKTNDAFVLNVRDTQLLNSNLTRRKNYKDKAGMWFEGNQFVWGGQSSSELANWLERFFKVPVIDQTATPKLRDYDFRLNWNEEDLHSRNSEKFKQALIEAGFDLISTNMPIEMLVVERVK